MTISISVRNLIDHYYKKITSVNIDVITQNFSDDWNYLPILACQKEQLSMMTYNFRVLLENVALLKVNNLLSSKCKKLRIKTNHVYYQEDRVDQLSSYFVVYKDRDQNECVLRLPKEFILILINSMINYVLRYFIFGQNRSVIV